MKTVLLGILMLMASFFPVNQNNYTVSSNINFIGYMDSEEENIIYGEPVYEEEVYEEVYDEEEEYLRNKYADLSWKVIINGEVFPITTYDYDGGDLDTEEALRLWNCETALPNYYLAEKRTSVGRAVRNLYTGDTVCLHGIDHRIIGIIYGVNNHNGPDEWLMVQNTMEYYGAWGAIQTCITGTDNMNVYLLD